MPPQLPSVTLSYFHVHTAINILRCFGYPREHNFGLVLILCFLSILHERVCDYSGVQSSVTGILCMGDMNIHITWLTHVRTGPKKKSHPGATFPHAGGASPVGAAPPVGGAHPGRLRICHLFNARDGPKCTYSPCKFAHVCSACKANHPRSACPKAQGTQADTSGRGGVAINKRLRLSE